MKKIHAMRVSMVLVFLMCVLVSLVFFGTERGYIVKAEEAGQFEVKNVLFADNGDYLGKPSYIVTVQPTSPFPLPGQTNLQWAGSGDESVRANIVINDYTVGEIESFNTQVVQVHRYTTEIVIYIYDGCGNLPCGEHATNAECTCEDKRPVLLLDGTDVLVFKAGLTTGGLAASAADSVWGLKDDVWKELHTLEHQAAKEATCTVSGNIEYWSCTVCGKYFEDAQGNTEIADKSSVEVDATGHSGGTATCQSAAKCSICGETYGELGTHTLEYQAAKEATCTVSGNIEYWSCTVCGKYFSDGQGNTEIADKSSVEVEATGHDFADGVCRICGAEELDADDGTEPVIGKEDPDPETGCNGSVAGSVSALAVVLLGVGLAALKRKGKN